MGDPVELIAAQMREWPDSRIVSRTEAVDWMDNPPDRKKAAWLALTIQWPQGVFYECGKRPDGTYRWRGFRFGTEGHEYLSNFPGVFHG